MWFLLWRSLVENWDSLDFLPFPSACRLDYYFFRTREILLAALWRCSSLALLFRANPSKKYTCMHPSNLFAFEIGTKKLYSLAIRFSPNHANTSISLLHTSDSNAYLHFVAIINLIIFCTGITLLKKNRALTIFLFIYCVCHYCTTKKDTRKISLYASLFISYLCTCVLSEKGLNRKFNKAELGFRNSVLVVHFSF